MVGLPLLLDLFNIPPSVVGVRSIESSKIADNVVLLVSCGRVLLKTPRLLEAPEAARRHDRLKLLTGELSRRTTMTVHMKFEGIIVSNLNSSEFAAPIRRFKMSCREILKVLLTSSLIITVE